MEKDRRDLNRKTLVKTYCTVKVSPLNRKGKWYILFNRNIKRLFEHLTFNMHNSLSTRVKRF